jgi:hypothetical protein
MGFALQERGDRSTRERARFVRETRAFLRERDRRQLAALRERLEQAESRQRAAMARVVAQCKSNRKKVQQRVIEFRASERERINREVAEMRRAAEHHCNLRKQSVRDAGLSVRAQRAAELEAERHLQRELRQTDAHAKRREQKFRRSAREVARESDDEVRANIDPELVAVWERVKRGIRPRPSAHLSRTEAFLQYVEENPEEVYSLMQDAADGEVAKLLREKRQAEKLATKRARQNYRPTEAELKEYLEGVPF